MYSFKSNNFDFFFNNLNYFNIENVNFFWLYIKVDKFSGYPRIYYHIIIIIIKHINAHIDISHIPF